MQFNEELYTATDIDRKLYTKLRKIFDFDDFVFGIMDYCKKGNQREQLLKLIKENNVTDKNEICLWAISIHDNRDINELKAKYL